MTRIRHAVLPALALVASADALPAQETGAPVDLAAITCREVMIQTGEARATAVAFLQGWMAGKLGRTSFGEEEMVAEAEAFLYACLDSPAAAALATLESIVVK